ncbi:hypothetical protein ACQUY5_29305 [Bacillus cereus]|uniref:hypothetical protein n=1 Tax=Bacillus cereus TaxID=1396 RepID=UPI003D1790DE
MNTVELRIHYGESFITIGELTYDKDKNRVVPQMSCIVECEDNSVFALIGLCQVSNSRVLLLLESKEIIDEEDFHKRFYMIDSNDVDFSDTDYVYFKPSYGDVEDFHIYAQTILNNCK